MIRNYNRKQTGAPRSQRGAFRLAEPRAKAVRRLVAAAKVEGPWIERLQAAIEWARGRPDHQDGLGAAAELLYHWRKGEAVTWPSE